MTAADDGYILIVIQCIRSKTYTKERTTMANTEMSFSLIITAMQGAATAIEMLKNRKQWDDGEVMRFSHNVGMYTMNSECQPWSVGTGMMDDIRYKLEDMELSEVHHPDFDVYQQESGQRHPCDVLWHMLNDAIEKIRDTTAGK